jgi:hypothetical protein
MKRRLTKWPLSRLTMFFLVLPASLCLGQGKGGLYQGAAVPMVQKVLSGAQLSGSLEFWGDCDTAWPRPEFAGLRPVTGKEVSALDSLREMFADDAEMRVTQDANRTIRMIEADVPQDFLEVKIHHISIPSSYHSGAMAVYYILNTPEVTDFMDRNIGREVAWMGWGMPGQIAMYGPSVPGELNDVTVAQALDRVLLAFPGFWTYENCRDPEGRRTISVGFHVPLNDASLMEGK